MKPYEKPILAIAAALCLAVATPAAFAQESDGAETPAETADLDTLLQQLQDADDAAAGAIEEKIYRIWSRSGSAAMDLLFQRGKEALEAGEFAAAIEHFGAAIDHAPDFAEAYNGRAAAFFQLREFGLAVADIQHVLALNPQHFGALEGLGYILLELGDKKNALVAFKAAQALNPHRTGTNESVERLEKELNDTAL